MVSLLSKFGRTARSRGVIPLGTQASNARFFIQAALNEPRHVVYHSHDAGILNPHRAYDAERAKVFV